MTDKKKQTKAGATELKEEDLKKVQGGAKYDGVDGEIMKKKAGPDAPSLREQFVYTHEK